jgi:hypothetical protein
MVQGYLGIKPASTDKVPTEDECRSFLDTMAVAAAKQQG